MSAFAKGRWEIIDWGDGKDLSINTPDDEVYCVAQFIPNLSNARLIAAAPELYRLMKSVVDFDHTAFKFDTDGNLVFTREKYDEFRDLLARIDGKESDKT